MVPYITLHRNRYLPSRFQCTVIQLFTATHWLTDSDGKQQTNNDYELEITCNTDAVAYF
jgi:hypothetical protein